MKTRPCKLCNRLPLDHCHPNMLCPTASGWHRFNRYTPDPNQTGSIPSHYYALKEKYEQGKRN